MLITMAGARLDVYTHQPIAPRLDEWQTHTGAWVQGCPAEADHVPACSFPYAASLGLLKTRLDDIARQRPFQGLRFECSKALGGTVREGGTCPGGLMSFCVVRHAKIVQTSHLSS